MKAFKSFVFTLAAAILPLAAVLMPSDAFARKKAPVPVAFPASSSEVVYTGRTLVHADTVGMSWSGVYGHVRFTGPSLTMDCRSDAKAILNVWVDKEMGAEADAKVTVLKSDTTVVLAAGLGKGEHEVWFQKRTEGSQGALYINKYNVCGSLLPAGGGKARLIEVIGDSYTCGFGTENSIRTDPFTPETENCNYAYGCILARYFGADYRLISHSGIGVARNYGDGPGKTMVDRYPETFDADREGNVWDFSSSKRPDIVVIYLGTNDFARNKQPKMAYFVSKYCELIGQVKKAYGDDVPVLCVASRIDELAGAYVKASVQACGYPRVEWMQLNERVHNDEDELGASWHPNYKGQKKVAMSLIPYISTLTGWPLEEKAVL